MFRRLARFFALVCPPTAIGLAALLLVHPANVGAESAASREDRIKAALVFKLVKFVDWPAAMMAGKEPIQICSFGDSPVAEALSAVDGRPARDRTAQFRKLGALSAAEAKGCHVLFVAGNAREIAGGLPSAARGRGVLTVSDGPDFARRGGMIGLARGENRVAFEINLRAARDSGLEPGAPLLELATIVE